MLLLLLLMVMARTKKGLENQSLKRPRRFLFWDKGKGFPTFGPVGPWLVTSDEVGDPQALGLWLEVNGRRVQRGNTSTMIFSVAQIVAYCSRFMTLEPGDIITTGTPPGVGLGQKPEPWYLKAGDTVRLGIDGLGEQQQLCVEAPRRGNDPQQ